MCPIVLKEIPQFSVHESKLQLIDEGRKLAARLKDLKHRLVAKLLDPCSSSQTAVNNQPITKIVKARIALQIVNKLGLAQIRGRMGARPF
jgi:hypothetical protein